MKPAHVCQNLRTKKMFIPAQEAEAFGQPGQELEYSPHCWCNRTLTEVGPDDRQVGIQVCNRSRSCFQE